jgi:tRNA A-37 threonylcarbamoyl transferase component Bud32
MGPTLDMPSRMEPPEPRAQPPSSPLPGKAFGDYELLTEVARGGMGVIYKARQGSLNRVVALKMILEGRLASEQAVQRFYQEARSAAALDHPHIVPVYEAGECQGCHFFTMAFVEGPTLAAMVRKRGLPAPAEAASLTRAIADAVAYAHDRGVIHRDLKPENVLVDTVGSSSKANLAAAGPTYANARPRVTDFGLAKCLGESGLTNPGAVMGTPSYMAPEQAWGRSELIGPPADVYALGGILYFLLTGRPPFEGGSVMEVLAQVTHQPPMPPRQVVPGVPEGLEAVCLRCLEKEPEKRYASAAEVAETLRPWCGEARPSGASGVVPAVRPAAVTPPPTPTAGPPRRRLRWALAALALALLLVPVVWLLAKNYGGGSGGGEPDGPLTLKVEILDSRPGPDGERLLPEGNETTFQVEVGRDAYVGIWNVAPDGSITQVFPNKYELDHFVRAGKPRIVPDPARRYAAEAVFTGGVEQVRVLASTKPWDSLDGERQGPYLVFKSVEDREKLEGKLREIKRYFLLKPKGKPQAGQVPEGRLREIRGVHLSEPAGQAGEGQVAEEVLRYRVLPAGQPEKPSRETTKDTKDTKKTKQEEKP